MRKSTNLPWTLSGKSAIVVGGAGRLGPVWCDALASAGAQVTTILGPSQGKVDSHYSASSPWVLTADVRDVAQVVMAAEAFTERRGQPADILVYNSGIDDPVTATTRPQLSEPLRQPAADIFDVNVLGALLCIQTFGRTMVDARRGSIILIGSLYGSFAPDNRIYAEAGMPNFYKHPAYPASKAAVLSLARYFAGEWGRHGVRVNSLSPGGVRAEQGTAFCTSYGRRVPMGRLATENDLIGPLLFLASDMSNYVNGIDLRVDGGYGVW